MIEVYASLKAFSSPYLFLWSSAKLYRMDAVSKHSSLKMVNAGPHGRYLVIVLSEDALTISNSRL